MKTLRRSGGSGGSSEEAVQQAPSPGKRTLTEGIAVQHKLRAGPAESSDVPAIAASGVAGGGGSLPHGVRIQQLFGRHDVSGVRAHTDGAAASANQQMDSEGYTTGVDVAFASSSPSLHTTAHEAAHVVQQRAGVHLKGGIGAAGDAYEQHADRVADLVVQGRSAEQELSQMTGAAGGTTAVQHRLKVTGAAATVQRVLGVMNRGLFGYTAQIDGSGFVTLAPNQIQGPPTARQQAMYNYLNRIISDAATVTIGAESGTASTLVGSYAGGTIDIADIEHMAGGEGATDIGALIHELVEQYHKQVNRTGFGGEASGAHHEGILAENAVNGTTRGPQRVISGSQNPDGTISGVVEVPYTYPNGRVVTTTTTVVRNNVTGVTNRETTPARSP